MEWQLVIALNVMMISFIALLFGLMNRHSADPWMLIAHALVVAVGGAALYLGSPQAGTYVSGLFLLLVATPGMLIHNANRFYLQARYPDAARYAKWAAMLHPSPSMRFNAAVLNALSDDDVGLSVAELEALRTGATPAQATQLDLTAARLKGRWDQVLTILADRSRDTRGMQEFQIRALGELGHTDDMVAAYEHAKRYLPPASLRNAQMVLLAFAGRPDGVSMLRSGKVSAMHSDFLSYWEAVAVFNARGRRGEGRVMLETVAQTSSLPVVRAAARRYLDAFALREPAPPSLRSAAVAEAIVARWQEAGSMAAQTLLRSPVTVALLIANALMFALEYAYGGVEDPDALVALGALWPPLVSQQHEWWRLGSALFLHFGWAHFILNMASLAILGRLVEGAFGSRRMLLIYALAGLGSMATVYGAMALGFSAADFVVGASGAIMALFGAWTARLVLRWRRSRDVLDRQPAILMAVVMAVQVGVDLSVPQISFTGHISGFIIGFLLALLISGDRVASLPADA